MLSGFADIGPIERMMLEVSSSFVSPLCRAFNEAHHQLDRLAVTKTLVVGERFPSAEREGVAHSRSAHPADAASPLPAGDDDVSGVSPVLMVRNHVRLAANIG